MDHFRSWGHTDTKKISYKTGGASKEKTGENQSENKRRRGDEENLELHECNKDDAKPGSTTVYLQREGE